MIKYNYTIETPCCEFLVIGDVHLSGQRPSCRVDDYLSTCLNKIEFILDYAITNNINSVFFEGDFFHRVNETIPCLSRVINLILRKKTEFALKNKSTLNLFTIVGNHDLPYENFKFIERSPLNLLFETGTLSPFKRVELKSKSNSVFINGFDYSCQIEDSKVPNECCIAHMFYNTNMPFTDNKNRIDNLTKDDAKKLGYRVYFLGHDHVYYGINNEIDYFVVRGGSLMRNTSHKHQVNRIPCFYHVVFSNDNFEFKEVEVETALRGDLVFTTESLNKPKTTPLIDDSIKVKISDIILTLSCEEKQNDSIIDILDKIIEEKKVGQEVKTMLIGYFSKENLI